MGLKKPAQSQSNIDNRDQEEMSTSSIVAENSTSSPAKAQEMCQTDPIITPEKSLPTKSPRSSRKKYHRAAICRQWDMARNVKKSAGVRQLRRVENMNMLMNLAENDEMDDNEVMDIVEPHFSRFAELFMEHEKMKVWNDFINRTEEDQTMILKHISEGSYDEYGLDITEDVTTHPEPLERESSGESWEDLGNESINCDKRQAHPGYSAEECFNRIEAKFRAFLKQKHVPYGTLEHLEEDVISFFSDFPTSVFISKQGSSFERMLLHALCQYLELSSKSFDISGDRQTSIENKQQQFTPPDIRLTAYLESRNAKAQPSPVKIKAIA